MSSVVKFSNDVDKIHAPLIVLVLVISVETSILLNFISGRLWIDWSIEPCLDCLFQYKAKRELLHGTSSRLYHSMLSEDRWLRYMNNIFPQLKVWDRILLYNMLVHDKCKEVQHKSNLELIDIWTFTKDWLTHKKILSCIIIIRGNMLSLIIQ